MLPSPALALERSRRRIWSHVDSTAVKRRRISEAEAAEATFIADSEAEARLPGGPAGPPGVLPASSRVLNAVSNGSASASISTRVLRLNSTAH